MKYALFYTLIILSVFNCFSQIKQFEVLWNVDSLSSNQLDVDYPTATNMNAELLNGVLLFNYTWKSAATVDVAQVLNPVYKTISESELGDIDKSKIKSTLKITSVSSFARGVSLQTITFNPIVKFNGQFKKVTSFSLNSVFKQSSVAAKISSQFNISKNSVLSQGDWFRFVVDTTGVYKITPQFLNSIGVDLNGVDANTIKIYGNGGLSLPLLNSENEIFDVPENPIKIVGAEDGVFSGNDYILFYGRGTRGFVQENLSHINPYDDNAYYYVTTGGAASKKITPLVEPTGNVDQVFDTYDYETFHEVDLENIGGLGRIWHGESFDVETARSFSFVIPNVVASVPVSARVKFSAVYLANPSIDLKFLNGSQELNSRSASFSSSLGDSLAFRSLDITTNVEGFNSDVFNVQINFNKEGDPSSEGFLDFISVQAKSRLLNDEKQFGFFNNNTQSLNGIGAYNIGNAQTVSAVWDVTNPYAIAEKVNDGSSELSFKFNLGDLKKYVAVNESDLYTPSQVANSKIENQDLKGGFWTGESLNTFNDIDYLIVTKESYLPAAIKLARFRTSNDNFKVKVVTTKSIYNEFSTGKQDVAAIRNFVKYIYDNATSPENRLRFLCVIGDGSYDYKDVIRNNTNDVPLFHSIRSNSFINSFSTDDFYGFMDENEGVFPSRDFLDIAVGRMIAPNLDTANDVVDKVIKFYDKEAFGDWRTRQLYISDDIDEEIDSKLQDTLNNIADRLKNNVPNINVEKLFADASVQQVSSGGERYPQVRRSILDAFESGVSYVNYFGHGGEDGISSETIFTAQDARELLNESQLPIFTTFTCELTRFDNPNRLTAGEFMYWNENGGAAALLTTTRQLTFPTAIDLNISLENVFSTPQGVALTVGEAIRLAKVDAGTGQNKRAVFCVGDPALGVPFPKPGVELTKINDIDIADFNGELKALDRVKLTGRVSSEGAVEKFNGAISVILFDKEFESETLANDNVRINGQLVKIKFDQLGARVFRGLATVADGMFEIEFILPKSVQLEVGEGRMSFYAQNNVKLEDRSGSQKMRIGGLNTDAPNDVQAPTVELFLNDESFVSGQNVNDSPVLIAKFFDENGINTAGGVGHDIIVILDDDEKNPIVLNDYYSTDLDDFTRGNLSFRLRNLSPGDHTLKVRASDVYNNSVFEEINFIVSQSGDFKINRVLNYPNPFVSYTEFWFTHNSAINDNLQVSLQILTVTGKIVRTINKDLTGSASYTDQITWDGKDDFGDKIGKGVYVYKISVKSALTNKTSSKFEKLVIL
ncbi:type IX secretion system sortase PorU [Aquimarina agarivorans]|uniref:type IX secretion system sortase PorU n=1 Tax=Aquimarina agarivorans TaxID=980584 RepID=UPI000248EB8C|nr:type IX secretion system sortase PorU [Aquimarina agarivorans]